MTATEKTQENAGARPRETGAITIFYDGQCPLCSREIAHYRRLRGADLLSWVDITRDHQTLAAHGLQFDVAMARFHVRDANGRWQTGAWAFVELWSQLPAYRWLAFTLRALRLLPLMDRVYSIFARRRVRRDCHRGTCTAPAGLESADSRAHSQMDEPAPDRSGHGS